MHCSFYHATLHVYLSHPTLTPTSHTKMPSIHKFLSFETCLDVIMPCDNEKTFSVFIFFLYLSPFKIIDGMYLTVRNGLIILPTRPSIHILGSFNENIRKELVSKIKKKIILIVSGLFMQFSTLILSGIKFKG